MKKIKNAAVVAAGILASASPALAEEAVQATVGGDYTALAAGLTIAIAAFGGVIAQGKVASSALESIGRNPGAAGQMGTPMILGLVLIESLVIYALVIAAKLAGIF